MPRRASSQNEFQLRVLQPRFTSFTNGAAGQGRESQRRCLKTIGCSSTSARRANRSPPLSLTFRPHRPPPRAVPFLDVRLLGCEVAVHVLGLFVSLSDRGTGGERTEWVDFPVVVAFQGAKRKRRRAGRRIRNRSRQRYRPRRPRGCFARDTRG